jgi:hypothetical protein
MPVAKTIIYSAPVPAATTTMKSTAMETTEMASSCKTVEIRLVSKLVVLPSMMDRECMSAIPNAPVRSIRVAVAVPVAITVGRPASSADQTE